MGTRFADLGIPFPLYEAPVDADDDSEYLGARTCCVCARRQDHCFLLWSTLVESCPNCAAPVGLLVPSGDDGRCSHCDAEVPLPPLVASDPAICFVCLRAGRGALAKETELGSVSFDGFRPHDGSTGSAISQQGLDELLRTPDYNTNCGGYWLVCCGVPMTYLGGWRRDDFDRHADDGHGARLYAEIVEPRDLLFPFVRDVDTVSWDEWNERLDGPFSVFECKACNRRRVRDFRLD